MNNLFRTSNNILIEKGLKIGIKVNKNKNIFLKYFNYLYIFGWNSDFINL